MKTSVEPATQADIEYFAREATWPTMRAWVGRKGEEPIALFGLARGHDARWYAFFDITDKARPYKVTIVKTARMVMEEAHKMGLSYVYAIPDENEPLARRWMQSLGFEPYGPMMRWKNEGER